MTKSWLERHSTTQDWEEVKAWQRQQSKKKDRKRRAKNKNRAPHERTELGHRAIKKVQEFWEVFKQIANTDEKIRLLRFYSNPGWLRVDDDLRKRLRREYHKAYRNLLVGIDDYCGVCGAGIWREKHHIIPLCYGGVNLDVNMIAICRSCHDAVHPWMKGNPA